MKIVIDIPEHYYENNIKKELPICLTEEQVVGILPKGHGDLVDRDAINSRFYDIWNELVCYSNQPTYKELLDKWGMCMDTAPTIIEADKAESEDDE